MAGTIYQGANHSHLAELPGEREGIDIGRTTLRRILVNAGLNSPRRRRQPKHRVRRQRMPREGMLIQLDGSFHPWLGDQVPPFTLLIAVDDATGTVPTPGSQLALFACYSYHGFITDRDGEMLELEADHRRHAEIENAIRDLKYGVGLNHLPSGRFPANAAWLAVQVLAHNLARWTARIGLGGQVVTTKTLRRHFFSLAGRLTRSARRLTLHLPKRWPWEAQFDRALARLRAVPLSA